ncbi:MAG TPA: ATP-binding protein, partial [Beijerinckiaceae bacterium]|nr:ATP-binding protein [Beijerinckiaceae bacterium]
MPLSHRSPFAMRARQRRLRRSRHNHPLFRLAWRAAIKVRYGKTPARFPFHAPIDILRLSHGKDSPLDLDPASAGLPADKDASEPGRAAERIAFTVDPAIIRSLIREQASTVEKAIAELVMNAVDAGADEIHIAVDQAGFTVRDNGRGFASRNEILTCFRRFGAPHVAGDATFGRFRIGRGQIMHWARCSWRSNTFE